MIFFRYINHFILRHQRSVSLLKQILKTLQKGNRLAILRIKGLDENVLAKFLRFSTGSDVILCEAIAVTFTSLVGKGRRPIFHTCGSVIELPATYEDFCDFREEWCSLMSNVDIEMGIA